MANLGADKKALAQFLKAPPHGSLGRGEAPNIDAPCFGRRTDPDSVLDVRMVEGIAHDFLCDACRHRLVADPENGWTYSKLSRAAGLGWPEIRERRIQELMAEEMRANGRIERQKTFARLQRETPETNIQGTEAPQGIARVR